MLESQSAIGAGAAAILKPSPSPNLPTSQSAIGAGAAAIQHRHRSERDRVSIRHRGGCGRDHDRPFYVGYDQGLNPPSGRVRPRSLLARMSSVSKVSIRHRGGCGRDLIPTSQGTLSGSQSAIGVGAAAIHSRPPIATLTRLNPPSGRVRPRSPHSCRPDMEAGLNPPSGRVRPRSTGLEVLGKGRISSALSKRPAYCLAVPADRGCPEPLYEQKPTIYHRHS